MFACVHNPSEVPSGNKGSCVSLATYLSKDKGTYVGFFSHKEKNVSYTEVVTTIDGNVSALGKNDSKFYMLSLNPSHDELCSIIGRSVNSIQELTEHEKILIESRLIDYTRQSMDAYALNFGRDSIRSGNDLIYYARIETSRIYKPTFENISSGQKIGANKLGLNYHVHVIVSRKSANGKVKLSPQVISRGNDWSLNGKVVRRGFCHEHWKSETQALWDNANGISHDRYIPKEDSIFRANNPHLNEIVQVRYNSVNAVLQEMRIAGYDVSQRGDIIYFMRDGITFNVSKIDLRARETKLSDVQKLSIYEKYKSGGAEVRDMKIYIKDRESNKWIEKTERYLRSTDEIVRLRDIEIAYAKSSPKEYSLSKMPKDMKEVFFSRQVSSYREMFPYIEALGYEYRKEGALHTFTKGDDQVGLSHSELKALEGVDMEIKRSIAERIDIAQAYNLKDDFLPLHGLSIEKRIIDGQETKKYYVVRDEHTNSIVNLGDIRKEHLSLLRGEHLERMGLSSCPDIRELSQCKGIKEDIFISKMEERGYIISVNKYDIELSKDGFSFYVSRGEIRQLSRTIISKDELMELWQGYQNGTLGTKAYMITFRDRYTKENRSETKEYIESDNAIVPKEEAYRAWREHIKAGSFYDSLPEDFKDVLGKGEYYSYQERIDQIVKKGYDHRVEQGEHIFSSSNGEVRLKKRDLSLFNGVSRSSQKNILDRVDFYALYKAKEAYIGGQQGISVERRDLPNGQYYYVVQDTKNSVTVRLSDLRKMWEQTHHSSILRAKDIFVTKASSKAVDSIISGEVKEAISGARSVQMAISAVVNPVGIVKRQLMQAVRAIVGTAFKEV